MAILASIGLMDIFIGFNRPMAIGIIKELYKKAQNRFSLIILIVLAIFCIKKKKSDLNKQLDKIDNLDTILNN